MLLFTKADRKSVRTPAHQHNSSNEKSAQRRSKHCSLAVVRQSQKNLPHHRPPSRGCRMAKI